VDSVFEVVETRGFGCITFSFIMPHNQKSQSVRSGDLRGTATNPSQSEHFSQASPHTRNKMWWHTFQLEVAALPYSQRQFIYYLFIKHKLEVCSRYGSVWKEVRAHGTVLLTPYYGESRLTFRFSVPHITQLYLFTSPLT
jgi:hypothetical protein